MMGCDAGNSRAWYFASLAAFYLASGAMSICCADDSYARNAARLEQMTPEQKEDLARKKVRFDGLTAAEKQHLRDVHASITGDPNAKELSETATRYARWLTSLDPAEKAPLLDIKDPQQRIARIKELMQQQEERRFRAFAGNVPEEDRKTVYKWLGEWLVAHFDEYRERLPRDARQRIDEAPDDDARRRAMIEGWERARRPVVPGASDYDELFKRFSSETQKYIESAAAAALAAEPEKDRTPQRQHELQQQRIEYIVQTARYSRFFAQVSQEELLKFYASMKPDDPRRERLEGKEGDELKRELQRMYNWEHMVGRGPGPGGRGFGPGPGPWGPPPGGRGEGRGFRQEDRGGPDDRTRPPDRFDDKGRGAKGSPAERTQPAIKGDSAAADTGKP
jgi:hypothetical protein